MHSGDLVSVLTEGFVDADSFLFAVGHLHDACHAFA